jgi:ubiquinone/menaquinone biosynthesis C-methylase UbiE
MEKYKKIESSTQSVYELKAEKYDQERVKNLYEKTYLDQFISLLPEDSAVLDLGCGAGEPIARYLIEKKVKVTGADYSKFLVKRSIYQP